MYSSSSISSAPRRSPLPLGEGTGRGRLAFFGGSFNPIHLGHTALASYLIDHHIVDDVFLAVSPLNPLKQGASDIAPYDHRLRMAQLAAEHLPHVHVTDIESRLPIPSYTYHTLQAFSAEHPDAEVALLIGADNWHAFDRWYRHEDILAQHRIFVYPRPGYDIQPDTLPQGVTFVPAPVHDVSSTQLREGLVPLDHWLHPHVIQYIRQHRLYSK